MPHGPASGTPLRRTDIPAGTAERLWARVTVPQRSDGTADATQCWRWTGAVTKPINGSGVIVVPGLGTLLCHRLAFVLTIGDIPTAGRVIRRTCADFVCVNPHHLACGSQGDAKRAWAARQPPKPPKPASVPKWHYKLTPAQITEAIRLRQEGKTINALACLFGVAFSTMWGYLH